MNTILIGSPVYQKPHVLKEFLSALEEADKGDHKITYYFVDDNKDERSSDLLEEFAKSHDVILQKGSALFSSDAALDTLYGDHKWKSVNLAKITCFKDTMIDYCIAGKYEYLLLIDSDVIMDRRSILQLLSDDKEIVSNIYWSQWHRNAIQTPNVFWIPDIYTQDKEFNVPMSFAEAHKIRLDTFEKLKVPGLYQVDGLGAFTLIKRSALEKGTRFKPIPNLKIPGEDRPFCIRAGVAGIDLYMDTVYPAYHLYDDKYIDRVAEFKRDGYKFDMCVTYEPDPVKKRRFKKTRRFIARVGRKLARDFAD